MKKFIIICVLLAACVGCDQSTKYTARHFLEGRPPMSFMGDVFRLHYSENSGGFLSLGAGLPEHVRRALFIVLVTVFLAGFLIYVIFSKALDNRAVASSALIIGGGIGNLVDRVINQGMVIDFMNIGIGPIRTGIFNVADVAIMAGVFMFVALSFKKPQH